MSNENQDYDYKKLPFPRDSKSSELKVEGKTKHTNICLNCHHFWLLSDDKLFKETGKYAGGLCKENKPVTNPKKPIDPRYPYVKIDNLCSRFVTTKEFMNYRGRNYREDK